MVTIERLLTLLKQSNPLASGLTADSVQWGLPRPTQLNSRNTQLTITAAPDSGLTGAVDLFYNRRVLSAVFGQTVSVTANQPTTFADVVALIKQRAPGYDLSVADVVPVDISDWQLNQFNAFVLTARSDSLGWSGNIYVSVWLKLPNDTAPDVALSAVLMLEGRVEVLETSMVPLAALAAGGVVQSIAGFTGNITREQLQLDKLDAIVQEHAPGALVRQNSSTDDMVFGQPVYPLTGAAVGLADARDVLKKSVVGLVADDLIGSNGGTGRIQTTGVLTGTVAQWERATGMVGGLVTNKPYYLDIYTGRISPFAPSERGHFLTLVGAAVSPTQLSINIEQPLTL